MTDIDPIPLGAIEELERRVLERIERELLLPAAREQLWEIVTSDGWLADEVRLDLTPGGDAAFRSRGVVKRGWVEEVRAPARLAFWWAADGDPATRVELTLAPEGDAVTRLRVVETRPLDVLDLVGTPLPGVAGRSFGPALVAA
jgi:uncharacterized protein YndB with AHSA1/START domain